MALTHENMMELFAQVAEKSEINVDELVDMAKALGWKKSRFGGYASKAARELADDKNVSNAKSTREDGLLGINDVRRALGDKVKTNIPSGYSSPQARKEAENHNMNKSDFKERTGRVLKNGTVTISIADVRAKLNSMVEIENESTEIEEIEEEEEKSTEIKEEEIEEDEEDEEEEIDG